MRMAIDQRLDWTGFESVEMILLLDLDQALQKPGFVHFKSNFSISVILNCYFEDIEMSFVFAFPPALSCLIH